MLMSSFRNHSLSNHLIIDTKMAAKIFVTICVYIVIIQTSSCQSIGTAFNPQLIGPGLVDGPLSAIDVAFGPNEIALGPMSANDLTYGPRIAANEMAYGPRIAANEMAYGSRIAANEMAYGPRNVANELAYGPRNAVNEMAYGSRIAANEMAYGPRTAANEMTYGSRIAANEIANSNRIAANELAYGPKSVANEMAFANMAANGLAYDAPLAGYGPGVAYDKLPASGGSFSVTSTSRYAPTGITVVSENTIEGLVAVNGELPLLSVVSLQGSLPTSGSGSIAYGCGNGVTGITNDGVGPVAAELAYGQRLSNEMDLTRLGRAGYGAGVL